MRPPGHLINAARQFYAGRRVFITGITGFKGGWLARLLFHLGADVSGIGQAPLNGSFPQRCSLDSWSTTTRGDILNSNLISQLIENSNASVVFHLAAQPLVGESYVNPIATYQTNVVGTATVLEAIALSRTVISFVNVTTDKVYGETLDRPANESDSLLAGYDPYSISKMMSDSLTQKFAMNKRMAGETSKNFVIARGGNVIGGGDPHYSRLVPYLIRELLNSRPVKLRNPRATRPWQSVLDATFAYALLGIPKLVGRRLGSEGFSVWNVGPPSTSLYNVEQVFRTLTRTFGSEDKPYSMEPYNYQETLVLQLCSKKLRDVMGWQPNTSIEKMLREALEFESSSEPLTVADSQICSYLEVEKKCR